MNARDLIDPVTRQEGYTRTFLERNGDPLLRRQRRIFKSVSSRRIFFPER